MKARILIVDDEAEIRKGLRQFLEDEGHEAHEADGGAALDEVLGPVNGWTRSAVPVGTTIPKPTPLFTKVDVEALLDED